MKRISTDLHSMKVNPLNFSRGDVVKKIYAISMTTSFVGVVTSVIPSTNKVEVQWPDGTGLEDPWDLIKVNPLVNPPVVREDKSHTPYQNQKYNESFGKNLQPYNVLCDYVTENIMPVIMMASDLFNKGVGHKQAYLKLKNTFDNIDIVKTAIEKIYTDYSINFSNNEKSFGVKVGSSKKYVEEMKLEKTQECEWCKEECPHYELAETEIGSICDLCFRAINSREPLKRTRREPLKRI